MNYTIIGSGKSGRGFIARMLTEVGCIPTYIDASLSLVQELKGRKAFTVEFFGNTRALMTIPVKSIFHTDDERGLVAVANSDVVFVSVGATNLPEVGSYLKRALLLRGQEQPLLIITAENAIDPAKKLNEAIQTKNDSSPRFLVTEAAIFCSTIEKPGSAVDILSEAYDRLPYDAQKASQFENLPPFLVPEQNFPLLLTRKIFTYNCASAAIAYLGAYKDYAWYADAANDASIVKVLDALYAKVNTVLCKVYGIGIEEQEAFAETSKRKFQNREVRDSIDRNARDANRKLASDERLIGPLLLMNEQKVQCNALLLVIASAIWYGLEKEEPLLLQKYKDGGIPLILSVPTDTKAIERVQGYFDALQKKTPLEVILTQQEL